MTDGLVLEGDLSDILLPTLLMSLYRDKETGVLTVEGNGYPKSMHIKNGNVVFASSKCSDDRLGESLLRRGQITVKEFIVTSKKVGQGKRLGEILVDLGILTSEEMILGVKNQLIEIIDSVLSLTKGKYYLELTDFSTEELITLSMDMPLLLYLGMKKVKSWRTIYSAVGTLETRLKRSEQIPSFSSSLELTSEEEHLLSIMSKSTTVDYLLEASYLSQFETYNVLWIFITLGLIKKESSVSKESTEKVLTLEELIDEFNDVFSIYFQKLSRNAEKVFKDSHSLLVSDFSQFLEEQEGFYRYGRFDPDVILMKLRSFSEEEKITKLNSFMVEVYYSVSFFAHKFLSKEEILEVENYIKTNTSLKI
jgi:hypothetical protein